MAAICLGRKAFRYAGRPAARTPRLMSLKELKMQSKPQSSTVFSKTEKLIVVLGALSSIGGAVATYMFSKIGRAHV